MHGWHSSSEHGEIKAACPLLNDSRKSAIRLTERSDLCFVLGWKSFEVFLFSLFHVSLSFTETSRYASVLWKHWTSFGWALNKHGWRSDDLRCMHLPRQSVLRTSTHRCGATFRQVRWTKRHTVCRRVSLATATFLEWLPDFHRFSCVWIQPRRGFLKRRNTDANEVRLSNRRGSPAALTHRHGMMLLELQKELYAPLVSSDGWLTPPLIKDREK